MTNDELCYLTARDALALFSERKLSPLDMLKAVIARAEKVQGEINCFADR
jgi:Asp-tRNA(Asn)/Glu-tRNA(Gln) amidotransferase A subunit family amidase